MGMRAWVRRWRVYLVALPLVLALGLGTEIYQAIQAWTRETPIDVGKGKIGRHEGYSFELVDVSVKKPIPGASLIGAAPKGDFVPVVATFRGRIDDPVKAGKVYCRSYIRNGDGLEWKAGTGTGYQPQDFLNSCDQSQRLKDLGSKPKPHEWYHVSQKYWVPRDLADDLHPIIRFQSKRLLFLSPQYLRFAG